MDYKKAIEILERNKPTSDTRLCGKELCTACEVAISAMQELQMYKDSKLCLIPEDVYGKQCDELDGYKKLGTLEGVRDAVDRREPKKISTHVNNSEFKIGNVIFRKGVKIHKCQCGRLVMLGYKFCPECGQAIDWSE